MMIPRWRLAVTVVQGMLLLSLAVQIRTIEVQLDSWFHKGEKLEVVKSYKYLGITLTPSMSLKGHMDDRLRAAKFAIVSVWQQMLGKNKIPFSVKLKIFHAVSRTVLTYGEQVWGFQPYSQLERLLKFFVKKACRLPINTPDYFIYRELRLEKMYLHTMSLHLRYLKKVATMGDSRLPKHIASEVCRLKCGWFREWAGSWGRHFGEETQFGVLDDVVRDGERRLEKMKLAEWSSVSDAAKGSANHKLYAALDRDSTRYIDAEDCWFVSNIMRARGEMMDLNYVPGRRDRDLDCSMCNMAEKENSEHFLARCRALAEYRVRYLGKAQLGTVELIEVLNGGGWENLNRYIRDAGRYRKVLIDEFSYC